MRTPHKAKERPNKVFSLHVQSQKKEKVKEEIRHLANFFF